MTTNPNISLIDQAEALVLQLETMLRAMPDRDCLNQGVLPVAMGDSAGLRDDLMADRLETMHAHMGVGNRAVDRLDRADA
jgi:hypothetical protein